MFFVTMIKQLSICFMYKFARAAWSIIQVTSNIHQPRSVTNMFGNLLQWIPFHYGKKYLSGGGSLMFGLFYLRKLMFGLWVSIGIILSLIKKRYLGCKLFTRAHTSYALGAICRAIWAYTVNRVIQKSVIYNTCKKTPLWHAHLTCPIYQYKR